MSNLQTVLASEDKKTEARKQRSARSRAAAESNNGNLAHFPLSPHQFFEAKYPALSDEYGAPIREEIDKRGVISVTGINEAYFAAMLGEKGSPGGPTIYLPTEGRFFRHDTDAGIFRIERDQAIASRINLELLEAVKTCKSEVCNTDALEFGLRDIKKLMGIVGTAKGQLEVAADFFASDPEYIAVANGILRVSDNTLLPFSWEHRKRNKLNVAFAPRAECRRFLKFLREALDDEDIETLQRWAGGTLTGANLPQKILILLGTAGGGKSTFIKILRGVVGPENFAMLRPSLLPERFEISRYLGKTVLYGPDVNGDFLNHKGAAVLKSLTGYDPMTVEFKNSNECPSMVGSFNVIVTCNSRLVVRLEGDTEAWRRRLIIVDYHKPKPENVIADLDQQILRDEGSGVLNWMLEGLAKLRADNWQLGLTTNQQATVDSLLLESDGHTWFVKEQIVKDDHGVLTVPECFTSYVEYANERGWTTISRNKFGRLIGDVVTRQFGKTIRNDVPDRDSGKAQRGWRGLKLKSQATIAETLKFDDPERQRAWDEWEDDHK